MGQRRACLSESAPPTLPARYLHMLQPELVRSCRGCGGDKCCVDAALHSDMSAHSSRVLYEPSIMIATGTSCATSALRLAVVLPA